MAVLLVVLNHLQTRVTGGYIGVDVFFVISGYLISATILAEMEQGVFSIAKFYERRVRRIAPALLAVSIATSLAAYCYLLPAALLEYSRSLLAAILSVSNILFWRQAGYFDLPSSFKPLLHTWSLGVEEQFYIVFPLLLLALRKFLPRGLRAAVWTLTIASFVASWFLLSHNADAVFFLAPLRAWELLLGCILSQHYLPAPQAKPAREIAAGGGLLLILIPALRYTSLTPFPGPAALLPCVGAMLIIAVGERGTTFAGRLLSWRPLVFVGLISYSLYLWHWPILVFHNMGHSLVGWAYGALAKVLLIAAFLAAGTLSWRFVETPFRKGKFRPSRRALYTVTGAAAAGVAVCGVLLLLSGGARYRYTQPFLNMTGYLNQQPDHEWRTGECFLLPKDTFNDFQPARCMKENPARKHYLLLGDSTGAALYPGLVGTLTDTDVLQANAASCLPLRHPRVHQFSYGPDFRTNCLALTGYIFGDYLLHHHVDAVLLSGLWTDADLDELGGTVAWLRQRGLEVVVFGPTNMYDEPLPALLAAQLTDHRPGELARHFDEGARALDRKMALLARGAWAVRYVSLFEDLCQAPGNKDPEGDSEPSSGCALYGAPGVPPLFDSHHLTIAGSMRYVNVMRARSQLP